MITNKSSMYQMLATGAFGNTIAQYFDVVEWMFSKDFLKYDTWGVRTLKPGGPCRLYCPRDEVADTVNEFAQPVNISCLIDVVCNVTAWFEVWDSPMGLVVEGIEYPPVGLGWRQGMPDPAMRKSWTGVQASMILRKHLNPNSLEDLEILRSSYPDHVFEMSACEQCFGTVPGRNAVMWEVRAY